MTPPSLVSQRVSRVYIMEWYEGVLAGIVRLEEPARELAIDVVARRDNPGGRPLYLAFGWPVPEGTLAAAEADEEGQLVHAYLAGKPGESRRFVLVEPDQHAAFYCEGAFTGPATLQRPEHPPLLLAYHGVPPFVQVWELDGPLDREAITRHLHAVALETTGRGVGPW